MCALREGQAKYLGSLEQGKMGIFWDHEEKQDSGNLQWKSCSKDTEADKAGPHLGNTKGLGWLSCGQLNLDPWRVLDQSGCVVSDTFKGEGTGDVATS